MALPKQNMLFSSPELTIDGTYNGNSTHPVVTISEIFVAGHGMEENVTLTGLPAMLFVDLFHPYSTTI